MAEHAQPILKWAGGKRQLVPAILPRLPERIDTYYEPFVGGGAIFFALAAEKRFRRAVLSDMNADLICVYRAVRDCASDVIDILRSLPHTSEDYYRIRKENPLDDAPRAARFIYLNKTGFNGLYRVNRAGQFNVPFGKYENPKICDEDNLRRASEVLQGVKLCVVDFAAVSEEAQAGDAVYFDPPYLPVSKTSSFAAYHKDPFGAGEHERLALLLWGLETRGVRAVLSNSDTPDTRRIFGSFGHEFVQARRNINSKKEGRGAISELLAWTQPERWALAEMGT